jgi:uncharacterized membrane protein
MVIFSIFAPLLLPKIKISIITLKINRTRSETHMKLTAVALQRTAIRRAKHNARN